MYPGIGIPLANMFTVLHPPEGVDVKRTGRLISTTLIVLAPIAFVVARIITHWALRTQETDCIENGVGFTANTAARPPLLPSQNVRPQPAFPPSIAHEQAIADSA